MSTEVAVTAKKSALDLPDRGELTQTMEVVRSISETDFVPRGIRGNNAAILACILYGREIGLGPMESLSEVHMIEGRPSLSAKAKVKRARQAGHDIWGTVDEKGATVSGKRGDNGREMTVSFTIDQAKAAGLAGKSNWKSYTEDMLWARAVSRLCRRLFTEDGMLTALDPDEAEHVAELEHTAEVFEDLPTVDLDEVETVEAELVAEPDDVALSGDVVDSVESESSATDALFTDKAREKGLIQ